MINNKDLKTLIDIYKDSRVPVLIADADSKGVWKGAYTTAWDLDDFYKWVCS
jgi:hypothetical protein